MEDQKPTSFTFEIDNFSEKEAKISSPKFLSGGCEWFLSVYPKGCDTEDHLSLYLCVANPESLRLGWKRGAKYSFALLNKSGEELYKAPELFCRFFCAKFAKWGLSDAVPLKKLQEKGFLEKNKLIVKVQVQVVEVVDEGEVTGNETFDFEGFQVPYSQVSQVSHIFTKHPDIAMNFIPKSQLVRTTYMNLLLGLIQKLDKPPNSFSETELSNTRTELMDLTEAGFKLDWLNTKLDEITLGRKKPNADDSRVQELEKQNENLKAELSKEKLKSADKVLSLEQKVSELKEKLNKEGLEKQNKSLIIAELNKEKLKSANKVSSLEQKVSELKEKLNKEGLEKQNKNLIISELNKEKLKSADKVLSLEQKVSELKEKLNKEGLEKQNENLKAELNKEKLKSADKVLSLEQKVSELKEKLNKEGGSASQKALSVKDLFLFWGETRRKRAGYVLLD